MKYIKRSEMHTGSGVATSFLNMLIVFYFSPRKFKSV